MFARSYGNVCDGNPAWNGIPVSGGELYEWNEASTYIQNPPFFEAVSLDIRPLAEIRSARVLGMFGEITTDHISRRAILPRIRPRANT
jgi:aconitate hydratase